MQLPVTLRLKSSSTLAVALVLAHGLAASGLAFASLSLAFKLPFWFLLACSLVFNLRRQVFRRPIHALTLRADGHLEVELRDGTHAEAQIHPHTTVFPWLAVLLLRVAGRVTPLALPADALGRAEHRQLRLWLRWKAAAD